MHRSPFLVHSYEPQRRRGRGFARVWHVSTALLFAAGLGATSCGGDKANSNGTTGGSATVGTDASTLPQGDLLRAAIASNKLLGAAVSVSALRDDATYGEVLAREFNYVTPENAMKWGPLEPSRGDHAWAEADTIVEHARAHSQEIKGHALVWHQQTPSWVTTSLGAEDLSAAIKRHIEVTLDHFRGRIRAWDVVNEAVDTTTASGYRESVFWQTLGPGYIESAFRWARAADPDVLLFYNDYAIERIGAKSDFTYAMIRDLLQKGVPIDGIGFQAHISTHRYPAESDLRANLRRFAELGLRVNISELDSRTIRVLGTSESRWLAQRIAFQQVVGVCVTEPGCEAITFWGFTDKYSWINDDGDPDDPLIFDRNYAPKPAYEGVLHGLQGLLPTLGETLVMNGSFEAGSEFWSVNDGQLSVQAAAGRDGPAACVTARTDASHGLTQAGLLDALGAGGTYAFSAWTRVGGATSASVAVSLTVEQEGASPQEVSLAGGNATDAGWSNLAGYFTLGYTARPTSITLNVNGPPAGVELCVAAVELRPVSPS